MDDNQDSVNVQSILLILGPLMCWADGQLDAEELNAADEIGKKLFKWWPSEQFRTMTQGFDSSSSMGKMSSENTDFIVRGLLESNKISELPSEDRKAILTFLTVVAMADGKYDTKEKEIIDAVADVLGLSEHTAEPSEKDLKAAKKQSAKKMLSIVPLMDRKQLVNLLAIVRNLNPHLSMTAFETMWGDVVDFIHRGVLCDLILMQESEKGKVDKEWHLDFELIKKSKIQEQIADIDFLSFTVKLAEDDFNWMTAVFLDKNAAAVISALTQIFYLHRLQPQRLFAVGDAPKSIRKPKATKNEYLDDWLMKHYDWNQNAFSNGAGQIDIVNGKAGLKPHTSLIKKLIKRPTGDSLCLEEFLKPEKTIIKFVPERLVSMVHSRDVNFWLSYFKNEAVFIGPDTIEFDIFGFPTSDLKPNEEDSILNKELVFLRFTETEKHTQILVFDTVDKRLWLIPSIVFHGCAAIEISTQ